MSIHVNSDVLEGIRAVRDSGRTNMFDRTRVIEILEEMGFDQAAVWVSENKKEYSHGIFQGFETG